MSRSATEEVTSQNQYRRGVLIYNFNEDKIGVDLAHTKPTRPEFTTTSKSFHGQNSSMKVADREPPQYTFNRFGQPAHELFGHGLNDDEIQGREFATAYDMSFKHRHKAHDTVDSHFKPPAAAPEYKKRENDERKDVHKPKSYHEMTRRCDNVMNNIGLRR